jgi:separase
MHWGTFPARCKIEFLIKIIRATLRLTSCDFKRTLIFSEECDTLLVKLRKCFQICTSNHLPFENHINLLLHKDLNMIPFESFSLFCKYTIKRIPFTLSNLSRSRGPDSSLSILKRVYYIVNPSGDLIQTQERFESVFKDQPDWEGIVGRRPTSEEFFTGICGRFQLFIYFGHSGGEIYAPLKDLKKKITSEFGAAASALLIGCSSGKIKPNGIFPAESSVFHYLENKR